MSAAEAAASVTTLGGTIQRGTPGAGGYAPLVRRAGESHVVRTDLGVGAQGGRATRRTGLLAFVQLSDVHVVDHQSPARVEWADRYDDRDVSTDPVPGLFAGAHRPQELLTAQVADAMVRAINEVRLGPVTGLPLSFALQTGDNSDNSQFNETRWNIDVLDGRPVRPDSGDLTRYEGVMDGDPAYYDTHYWHPEGTPAGRPDDLARSRYGFPVVTGLTTAARRRFTTAGLDLPWYTAFGNHDQLVQGNFPHTLELSAIATGNLKVISPPPGVSEADLLHVLRTGDPSALLPALAVSPYTKVVTPDPDRRTISRAEVIAEHFRTTGTPVGHGYRAANRESGLAYYTLRQGVAAVRRPRHGQPQRQGRRVARPDPVRLARQPSRALTRQDRGRGQPPHRRHDDQHARRHRRREPSRACSATRSRRCCSNTRRSWPGSTGTRT